MEEFVLDVFADYRQFAFWISIAISVLISILGVLPSVFVTAANIAFFGFTEGLYVSLAGEALGAIISFFMYRKGLNKINIQSKNKFILKLQTAKGIEAFFLIFALRLFPFAPSGLVTLAGAGSGMGIINYSIASTVGKIPALLLEAYTVSRVINLDWQAQLILAVLSIIVISILYYVRKRSSK